LDSNIPASTSDSFVPVVVVANKCEHAARYSPHLSAFDIEHVLLSPNIFLDASTTALLEENMEEIERLV